MNDSKDILESMGPTPSLAPSSPAPGEALTGSDSGRKAGANPTPKRCTATTRSGKPCSLFAMQGDAEGRCWYHAKATREQHRAAGRRGNAVSRRVAIEAADLGRIRTPRTVQDVVRELAATARAVQAGRLTPNAAREIISALNSIVRAFADQATVQELARLSSLLEERGDKSGALMALLDRMGEGAGHDRD